MADLLNVCRFTAGSDGTDDFADGTEETGFLNLEDAGGLDGHTYPYRAENATRTEWEIGYGLLVGDSSGPVLVRSEVVNGSSGPGVKVDFSTNPVVLITPLVDDVVGRAALRTAELQIASLALAVSEYAEAAVVNGETFADGFGSLGMVDDAGATNLDTGEAGYLKPTVSSGTTVTQGTADGTANYAAQLLFVDRSAALTNGDVITQIGVQLTNAESMTVKIVKRNSAGNYDIVVSESFSHPGGGFANKTLSTPYTVPGSGDYYIAMWADLGTDTKRTATISRALNIGSDIGVSTGVSLSEDTGHVPPMRYVKNPTAANLSVESEVIPIPFEPATISGEVRVVPVDALTLNTDITFAVSRDGGDTYVPVTLELAFQYGGTSVLRFTDVSMSGTPAGDEGRWRFASANNKNFKVAGVALEFYA